MELHKQWECKCAVCDATRRIAMTLDFITILSLLAMTDDFLEREFIRLHAMGVGVSHMRTLLSEAARLQHAAWTGEDV